MSDLISRQKAKDAIDMALDHIDHVPPWVYDNLLNALNEVPSVQLRKGLWIRQEDNILPIICECSNCGFDTTNFELFSFCPNCGADMRGDSDDSN